LGTENLLQLIFKAFGWQWMKKVKGLPIEANISHNK
jgi:hypothetical protein